MSGHGFEGLWPDHRQGLCTIAAAADVNLTACRTEMDQCACAKKKYNIYI